MTKSISIRVATRSDFDDILQHFREFFYPEEPIVVSHPKPGHSTEDEDFTMSFIDFETMLIAIDDEIGSVVGALSAGPIEIGDFYTMVEEAKNAETIEWQESLMLLAFIRKKSCILERLQIPSALHIHGFSVNQNYRGQRIGEKLFKFCFENALRLNYPIVTADCTSVFSIALAKRCEMDQMSRVTYDEYHKNIGEEIFQPKAPNFEIITFAKKILYVNK